MKKDGISYVVPFILITSCFALWGFANDITNPMVKAFSKIFRMSVTDGALVQVAFYGGYFAMAFPAAIFIRKYSYKAGVLMGLLLYAVGAFMFFPAKYTGCYYSFLLAYFILTCGLSFLETSCNPYILSMGTEETATRRLNLAQSFNPIGSLLGMYVAMNFFRRASIRLTPDAREQLSEAEYAVVRDSDLSILIQPYVIIGVVILFMVFLLMIVRMPKNAEKQDGNFMSTIRHIFRLPHYREGVIAQFLLCRCADYVLDVYHTVWYSSAHADRYVGERRRGDVAALQHHSHGNLLLQPLHLHVLPKVLQCRRHACHVGRGGCISAYRSDIYAEHLWPLLSCRRFCLHVTDVPHDLRNSLVWIGRVGQVWCRRTYHGHTWRKRTASVAGSYHRSGICYGAACYQRVVCSAANLFPRDNMVWRTLLFAHRFALVKGSKIISN